MGSTCASSWFLRGTRTPYASVPDIVSALFAHAKTGTGGPELLPSPLSKSCSKPDQNSTACGGASLPKKESKVEPLIR